MNEHEKIELLISAYFDNEATPAEKDIVEEHILGCASCKKYFQDLNKLSSSLKSWKNEPLSPDLEQKIQTSLLKAREGRTMKPTNTWIKAGSGALVIGGVIILAICMKTISSEQLALRREIKQIAQTGQPSATQVALLGQKDQLLEKPAQVSQPPALAYRTKSNVEVGKSIRAGQLAMAKDKKEIALTETANYEPYYLKSDYAAEQAKTAMPRSRAVAGLQVIAAPEGETAFWGAGEGTPAPYTTKGRIAMPYPAAPGDFNTEQYNRIYENEFLNVRENPLSTFSIDVDTASYANVRRFLNNSQLPPADAVRIEEMINYFVYNYPQPKGNEPFSITTEAAVCPWNPKHTLAMIGLQGKDLTNHELVPSNLVFLIDVSGSMNEPNKLPLLKESFKLMVNQLRGEERVAIVTYAGNAGLVLDSTPGSNKRKILDAIDRLEAGGSTAGGAGIQLAYQVAKQNFIHNGNNRVILATDGDFNVGVSSDGELTRIIEEKRQDGIFLTVLGFGTGNYKDSKMEQLADKGNGNYYYIDTLREGKKVLVNELGSMLFAIAKDVKIQIEFNPAQVKAYRLVGYENRMLAKEDFNDDTKDAGELGAGHTVTAFYELIPADSNEEVGDVDPLKYQKAVVKESDEVMTVKLRYKKPEDSRSQLITQTVRNGETSWYGTSENFRFASAVAEFGLLLRDSKFKGNASFSDVLKRAQGAMGNDAWGYRAEFTDLVKKAQNIRNSD